MENISLYLSQENINILIYLLITLIITIVIDNISRSFIKVPKAFENRRSRTYVIVLRKTISAILYITAFYLIFRKLGIDVTPLLASASIVGIVVGIGARALVEDLINGFFLLTQDSVALGDYVKIDDTEGTIEKLGFRSLTVRGDNGEMHIIPNGLVKRVINFSRYRSYMNVDFPVKSDQDIDMTLKAMTEALEELQKEKEIKHLIYEGTEVLGIMDYKIDGRIIVRGRIITSSEMRFKIARKYRYLAKKNFEKYKIALC